MFPITELRLAIPIGVSIWGLSWQSAFLFSIAGNLLISIPILFLLKPVSFFLQRWKVWRRFFKWLFARTRKRGYYIDNIKFLGLVLFVALPLPGTGAWTGCVASFVFGVNYKKSLIAIFLGLIISASIVTLLTMLSITLIK